MSHHDQVPAIPLREHMICAKAATLLLRGIITTGESPDILAENATKPEHVYQSKPATPAPASGQPAKEMPTILAMMKEREKAAAKAWREKRAGIRPRTEDEQTFQPNKKSKMS